MKQRTFTIIVMAMIAVLGCIIGESIKAGNAIVPVIAMAIAMAFIYLLKKRVSEIVEDERIYKISEKAAMFVFKLFVPAIAVIGVVLVALTNSGVYAFEKEGYTLLYSVCVMLILYIISYFYYNKKG